MDDVLAVSEWDFVDSGKPGPHANGVCACQSSRTARPIVRISIRSTPSKKQRLRSFGNAMIFRHAQGHQQQLSRVSGGTA